MRFSASKSQRRMDRVTINMASMIDVTFLLLFFFMVATVLGEKESRLSTALQTQSDSGSPSDFQTQNIEVRMIDGQPGYRLGANTCRDRDQLVAALMPLPKTAGIFIKVFDDVQVHFAVAAVQTARDAGFEKVTYVPGR